MNGKLAALLAAFFACTCAKEPAQPPVPSTSTPPPQTTAQPSAEPAEEPAEQPEVQQPAQKNVTIEKVELANPIVVTGQARTFENSVSLRVRDARGALITETFTTATGEMGQFSPYRGTVWLTRDPGSSITVEALEYSAKDGSEQSLVSAKRPFAIQSVAATLYFPDKSCTNVRPYTRRIPKSISAARLLVEALVAGPTAEERRGGAEDPFPKGSRAESVILRGGTITVDFNERLQNVGGACRATMIRQAVTETLKRLASVKKVVITAGGSEALALQP